MAIIRFMAIERRTWVGGMWVQAVLLLAAVALVLGVMLWAILSINAGHFVYTLDDAYIHLTVADHLLHGSYGLNRGEFSSPESTILWPLLLAPFAAFSWGWLVPLLINAACCVVTARLLLRVLAQGYGRCAVPLLLALMLSTNSFGLVFMGMEHSLQVLLAVAITVAMIDLTEGRALPRWLFAVLIFAPLVRFEMLGFSVGVMCLLLCYRQWRYFWVLPIVGTALAAFSLMLWWHTGEMLPASVTAKLAMNSAQANSQIVNYTLVVLTVASMPWLRHRPRAMLHGWMMALMLAHVLVGKSGWFSRYEIYVMLPALLLMLVYLPYWWGWLRWRPAYAWVFVLALPLLLHHYVRATLAVPGASHCIYGQQVQMRRLLDRAGNPDVAVNDVGVVAYQNPAYVLDLWGLGSHRIQQLRASGQMDWLGSEVGSRQIPLVMLYRNWYSPLPQHWVHLGTLEQLPFRGLLFNPTGQNTLEVYATSHESKRRFDPVIAAWKEGLPPYTRWVDTAE